MYCGCIRDPEARDVDSGADASCCEQSPPAWSHAGPGHGSYEKIQDYTYAGEGKGSWKKEVVTTHRTWQPRVSCLVLMVILITVLLGYCAALYGPIAKQLEPYIEEVLAVAPFLRPAFEHSLTAAHAYGKESLEIVIVSSSTSLSSLATTQVSKASTSPAPLTVQLPLYHGPINNLGNVSKPVKEEQELFDCDAGSSSAEIAWSLDKRDWCCDRHQRGCPATTTALPPSTAAPTTTLAPRPPIPTGLGCYTLTNRSECCKYQDGRSEDPWPGQSCVPAAAHESFSSDGERSDSYVCQPACYVQGTCGGSDQMSKAAACPDLSNKAHASLPPPPPMPTTTSAESAATQPIKTSESGDYVMRKFDAASCPAGYAIGTVDECKAAALQFGITAISKVNKSSYPPGCSAGATQSAGRARKGYFNSASGLGNPQLAPICKPGMEKGLGLQRTCSTNPSCARSDTNLLTLTQCCPNKENVMLACCTGKTGKFDGVWTSKAAKGKDAFTISGPTIHWDAQSQTQMSMHGTDGFTTSFSNEPHARHARLEQGELKWNIGDTWVKWDG